MKIIQKKSRRRGAALVEYGLIVSGVALISAAAVSIFGHKTSDLIAAVASVLPGAHADDNGPIVSGKLIETTNNGTDGIALNVNAMTASTERLGNNVLGTANNTGAAALNNLIVEAN